MFRPSPDHSAPSKLLFWIFVIAAITNSLHSQSAPDAAPRTVRSLGVFEVPGGESWALAASPKHGLLASGGAHGEVYVQSVADRSLIELSTEDDHWIGALRFTPDGRFLAAVGRSLVVFEIAKRNIVLEAPTVNPRGLDISPDGSSLVFVDGNGRPECIDTSTWKPFAKRPPIDVGTAVEGLAFTQDGSRLLLACTDGTVRSVDAETSSSTTVVTAETGDAATSMQRVVTCTSGVIATTSRGAVHFPDKIVKPMDNVYALAVDQTGTRVAIGGPSRRIALFDADGQEHGGIDLEDGTGAYSLAWVDPKHLAVATSDGRILVFEDAKLVSEYPGHGATPRRLAFSADSGAAVATGRGVATFDVKTGERRQLSRTGSPATGRRGGEFFLLSDGKIEVWDAHTLTPIDSFDVEDFSSPDLGALSPDGRRFVAAAGDACYPMIFDFDEGKLVRSGTVCGGVMDLCFEKDGRAAWLAINDGSHGERGALRRMDRTGSSLEVRDEKATVETVAISPDGKRLAYSTGSGSLYEHQTPKWHVLDLETGRDVASGVGSVRYWRFLDDDLAIVLEDAALALRSGEGFATRHELIAGTFREACLSPDRRKIMISDQRRVRVLSVSDTFFPEGKKVSDTKER